MVAMERTISLPQIPWPDFEITPEIAQPAGILTCPSLSIPKTSLKTMKRSPPEGPRGHYARNPSGEPLCSPDYGESIHITARSVKSIFMLCFRAFWAQNGIFAGWTRGAAPKCGAEEKRAARRLAGEGGRAPRSARAEQQPRTAAALQASDTTRTGSTTWTPAAAPCKRTEWRAAGEPARR